MNLTLLPQTPCQSIMQFLDWNDLLALKRVSKQVAALFSYTLNFWSRECFRTYFSFELEHLEDLYQNPKYKGFVKNIPEHLSEPIWKKHFETGKRLKDTFQELLCRGCSSGDARNFINYLFQQLRDPEFPPLKLKRETVICSTNTLFQNKLTEILYEDPSEPPVGGEFCERKIILDGILSKYQVNDAIKSQRNLLMQLRWYQFETMEEETKQSSELLQLSAKNQSGLIEKQIDYKFLMELAIILQSIFKHQCSMIHDYLEKIPSGYHLLVEYYTRWNTYVASILAIETVMQSFISKFNQVYEGCFPDFPSFPKFSIWRLMAKIWLTEVYEKANLSKRLIRTFLRILSARRTREVKISADDNFHQTASHMFESAVPKNLYVDLKAKHKPNELFKTGSISNLELFDIPSTWLDSQEEEKLLSNFIHSVMDLSFNEVTIHYMDCTDSEINFPYKELEQQILHHSGLFYEEYQPDFIQSPNYFCYFLKCDFRHLSAILPLRTTIQLEKIQIYKAEMFYKTYVCNIISKLDWNQVLKTEVPFTSEHCFSSNHELHKYMNDLASSQLQEDHHILPIFQMFTDLPHSKITGLEIDWQKKSACITKEVFFKLTACIESSYSDFRKNFEFLNGAMKKIQEISAKDLEIRRRNADKNIPDDLGDIDSLFYDLNKEVEPQLVCKLYADIKGLSLQSVLKEMENVQSVVGNLSRGNEKVLDLDFDEEFNIDDLPSLELN